jgi:hypothetical protein
VDDVAIDVAALMVVTNSETLVLNYKQQHHDHRHQLVPKRCIVSLTTWYSSSWCIVRVLLISQDLSFYLLLPDQPNLHHWLVYSSIILADDNNNFHISYPIDDDDDGFDRVGLAAWYCCFVKSIGVVVYLIENNSDGDDDDDSNNDDVNNSFRRIMICFCRRCVCIIVFSPFFQLFNLPKLYSCCRQTQRYRARKIRVVDWL